MPKVMVLPDHVASQIAAGEVVERPASVVKELVENSIDAGATQIEIAIGSECRDIRIADNGCGMDPEDALLAFQRHATSKLQTADDLFSLRTLGFRGEALPSIASVSKVTAYTRTADASAGTRIDTADGHMSARETGCAHGTVIEITDLFYNVPARLSFLKKPSTEFGHVHEIVQSLAVAYPKIVFQLLNHGEVVLRTSGSGKLALVMQEVGILSGREQLIDVTHADLRYGMAIYGYVARPPVCRGDRRGILAIVNNRPVRCPVTFKALDYAFADLIPKGKHPVGVLTITINPREVDANIHPTKKEVKYGNGSDVYLAVQSALKAALRAQRESDVETGEIDEETAHAVLAAANSMHGALESASGSSSTSIAALEAPASALSGNPTHASQHALAAASGAGLVAEAHGNPKSTYQRLQQISFRDRLAYTPSPTAPPRVSSIGDPDPAAQKPRAGVTLPAGWRTIGYLHNTYILVQTSEGLEVIEQHIAHERVIYERILAQQQTPGRVSENSQKLVISAPLNLSAEQRACLGENTQCLRALGFDFDIQGDQVSCTQVPLELATKDYASSVQVNVENLLIAGATDFELEASKSLACQAAIKNGMPLSESEIVELLSEWYKCPRNDTCPHGRPIALSFSKDKLFDMFHPK
jgi:DNA mismatch repair protein MutL